MVTVKLVGGLGNQLFQISAAYALSKKWGQEYCIPKSSDNCHKPDPYSFSNIKYSDHDFNFPVYKEGKNFEYHEIPKYENVCLEGYFQSEQYFANYREEILKLFDFDWRKNDEWVSIHVRRGDYLKYPEMHPVLPVSYYEKAMQYFIDLGFRNFHVFSDDIAWCKYNLPFRFFMNMKYNESGNEIRDLEDMSGNSGIIMANSTYSWWAAWLNQNPYKKIIAPGPDKYYGPEHPHFGNKTLIPESWTKM